MRTLSRITFVLVSLLAGACSLTAPRPAADLYVLKPGSVQPAGSIIQKNLRITLPGTAPGLDTARIAVLESPEKLNYYTGIAWAQNLPVMVQSYLLDTFQQAGLYKSASSDKDGVYADLILMTDIRDAQVENGDVHISLNVKLLAGDSRKVLSAFHVDSRVPAGSGTADMVKGFNTAMQKLSDDIISGIQKAPSGLDNSLSE